MSDILLQFNWDSKNTLTSIDFYLRKGTGITDKLHQLESLNSIKELPQLEEQLIWNDIMSLYLWNAIV
jgi:hypothetical protein